MQRRLRIEIVEVEIDRNQIQISMQTQPPENKRAIVLNTHIMNIASYLHAHKVNNLDSLVGMKGYVNTDEHFNPIKLELEFPVTLEGEYKVTG